MTRDPDRTHTLVPVPADDPAFDVGLAVAFGPDSVQRGWSRPPLLRDDSSDDAPLVRPDSPDMPKADPGRYQLLGEIARGGMGVILKGRDPDLGRDLAVKVLKVELAGRAAAEQRFQEEAQVCGQLQHPGVVPVYELGRFANGQPFFTMKLVKGHTLAALFAERSGPVQDRVRFLKDFEKVCQTMAYAHSRGVIHRDLKPANIMVGSFGEVQVMDWGLAKVIPQGGVADEQRATEASRERERPEYDPTVIQTARSGPGSGSYTEAGSVMGTPAFMPPEQAGGEVDKLDERADVFGLGAILCVILTGQPPYVADDPDAVRLMAIRGQLADCFARLDACGADADLVALCKRCLAADREARPRHAGAVRDALTTHLAEVESRAHRADVARAAAEARAAEEVKTRRLAEEKAAEAHKRRRVQLALVASVGLFVFGGGAVGWWQDRQAADRRAAEWDRRGRTAEAVAGLVGQGEDALRANDPARAAVALAAAEQRAAESGIDDLADRLAGLRADLAVLRALDAADQFRWTPVENRLPDDRAVAGRYRGAFGGFGGDPSAVGAGEAARRVAGSAVRDRLVAALDWVLLGEPSAAVRAALRAADPDPFRDGVRDALAAGEVAVVARWAGRPAAANQPAGFVAVLGAVRGIPAGQRRELLAGAVRRRPGEFGLLMALGNTYPLNQRDGAPERVRWFQAAVAAAPTSAAAHNNLGIALHDQGDLPGAIAAHREAVRLDPKLAMAHHNLGATLGAWGDAVGAIAASREAVRLDPKSAFAHTSLGFALRVAGDVDGAIEALREAIRLDPKYAPAHYNLGNALGARGDAAGAIAAHREAIRLNPRYHFAHNGLAWILATGPDGVRDGKNAVEHAAKACELNAWKDPGDIDTLAAAYAEAGDFDKAVEYQKKAAALAAGNMALEAELRSRIGVYEQKHPYRDPALVPREIGPPPRLVR